jgi:hypothetical protein
MPFTRTQEQLIPTVESSVRNGCPTCDDSVVKISRTETTYLLGLPISSTPEVALHYQCQVCEKTYSLGSKNELMKNVYLKKGNKARTDTQVETVKNDHPVQILSVQEIPKSDEVRIRYEIKSEPPRTKNDKLLVTTIVICTIHLVRECGADITKLNFDRLSVDYPTQIPEIRSLIAQWITGDMNELEAYTATLIELARKEFTDRTIGYCKQRTADPIKQYTEIHIESVPVLDLFEKFGISGISASSRIARYL